MVMRGWVLWRFSTLKSTRPSSHSQLANLSYNVAFLIILFIKLIKRLSKIGFLQKKKRKGKKKIIFYNGKLFLADKCWCWIRKWMRTVSAIMHNNINNRLGIVPTAISWDSRGISWSIIIHWVCHFFFLFPFVFSSQQL